MYATLKVHSVDRPIRAVETWKVSISSFIVSHITSAYGFQKGKTDYVSWKEI